MPVLFQYRIPRFKNFLFKNINFYSRSVYPINNKTNVTLLRTFTFYNIKITIFSLLLENIKIMRRKLLRKNCFRVKKTFNKTK